MKLYECDEPGCGRTFDHPSALNGHQLIHKGSVECPECGRMIKSAGGLGAHRTMHGVRGSGDKARRRKAAMTPAVAETPRGLDRDWTVDDIFTSVIALLWPGGEMPVSSVVHLVHWREATQEMLVKVGHE